ncbi:CLUMA_CG006809, isoform A [Clunio marinus]|uniref:CLUMA_CG006809, isoform A n=1 Tax=Clunio marinus TaxID=568069 RepID=A0A1J1I0G2_9DIPT|nr:CLUMA_CG006809, isoform A [Clunio marinus]
MSIKKKNSPKPKNKWARIKSGFFVTSADLRMSICSADIRIKSASGHPFGRPNANTANLRVQGKSKKLSTLNKKHELYILLSFIYVFFTVDFYCFPRLHALERKPSSHLRYLILLSIYETAFYTLSLTQGNKTIS